MKRLVVCCDGTWNTADQQSPTNVARFHDSVAPRGDDGVEQRPHYHPGVGTNWWDRWAGGAFGVGLSEIVLDAYRWVVANFEPGDELFLVGFSRGAYTARSTVGLIRNCGVLRPAEFGRVHEAYDLYRRRDPASGPDAVEAKAFRERYAHETRIRFVGVWDTVGALGIPFSGNALVNRINKPWHFHDTKLSSTVDHARQALAIDERRRPFAPAVWAPPASGDVPRRQVWFPGVHSDVGGGYPDRQLADVTLRWIVEGAADAGLAFHAGTPGAAPAVHAAANAGVGCDPVHDSMTLAYRLLVPLSRTIGEVDHGTEAAASTAVARQENPACRYAPENLRTYLLSGGHVDKV
ncbi:MAG: DUF2235 domain-containing protein [Actinomycetota bacterium]|nr:DUF2235 domain-containing protein [Actinomycetota bacterium]